MPSKTLTLKYKINQGIAFSADELLEGFFHGISICDEDGNDLSYNVIEDKIRAAQKQMENTLSVKLTKTFIKERREFIRGDYYTWGFLRVTYPISGVSSVQGYLNNVQQIDFPNEWLSTNSEINQEDLLNRQITLVPTGSNATVNGALVYIGVTPHLGFWGYEQIPNYWDVQYCTGFEDIPFDIREFVGKLASISVFAILGDILLGAGIASQSLSVDGLSQSIATTQSAENSAYSARVRQYAGEMKNDLPNLISYYRGITFTAL